MKYLVDANVLSEPTKPRPVSQVVQWLHDNESELATNVIALGELEYGILLLPASKRRRSLEQWFHDVTQSIRVLDFDTQSSSVWAQLLARLKKKGLAMSVKDSLIAASAMAHDLSVVTRNVGDFRNAGVRLVNPFEA